MCSRVIRNVSFISLYTVEKEHIEEEHSVWAEEYNPSVRGVRWSWRTNQIKNKLQPFHFWHYTSYSIFTNNQNIWALVYRSVHLLFVTCNSYLMFKQCRYMIELTYFYQHSLIDWIQLKLMCKQQPKIFILIKMFLISEWIYFQFYLLKN